MRITPEQSNILLSITMYGIEYCKQTLNSCILRFFYFMLLLIKSQLLEETLDVQLIQVCSVAYLDQLLSSGRMPSYPGTGMGEVHAYQQLQIQNTILNVVMIMKAKNGNFHYSTLRAYDLFTAVYPCRVNIELNYVMHVDAVILIL